MDACGCSDEDRTAKIKEEVDLRCGIMVHLFCTTWLHLSRSNSLSEMDGPDIKWEFFYKSMFSLKKM